MTNKRYKTGQLCEETGTYAFDGYVDGSRSPTPTREEQQIPLRREDEFPPVKSAKKGAWWRQI